ncbi:hypothetical protein BKK51_12435 [Rodentibacter trehalosifermentans]|uniref:Uncharacterized protein n=1 Tax=Rodentibacter trehalosifermentans TaxID=1908263 RepID=A0A1V3ILF8_9PAST|nr:hypothetical protein [Rodentibacter trehalosifermentans]OOF42794.1 hypothetical protein BKK51_12435 [Rodentibacter trehalosifermentans]
MNTYSLHFPNGAELEFFASDEALFSEGFFGLEFPKNEHWNNYERRMNKIRNKRKAQKVARRKNRK